MLPDWLDSDTLQWLILVALAVLLVVMVMIMRFVRKLVVRTILLAVVAGFGLSLWVQRADLDECLKTCECSLYGQQVGISYDQLPQAVRDRIDSGDTDVCPGVSASN